MEKVKDKFERDTKVIAFSRLIKAKEMDATLAFKVLMAFDNDIDLFFSLSADELIKRNNISPQVASRKYRQRVLDEAKKEAEFTSKYDIDVLWHLDPDYPDRLKYATDAPAVLYRKGTASLNPRHAVAIVGTRMATSYGIGITREIVAEFKHFLGPDAQIISGLAYGIDVNAHIAALKNNLETVAVMPTPINTIYPAAHRSVAKNILEENGALITEYSTAHPIKKHNFLNRNKIVAGMADCVIVVESKAHGGATATARVALEYGRTVFSVPGRLGDIFSEGCIRLQAEEIAIPYYNCRQVLKNMGWDEIPQEGTQQTFKLELTELQGRVMKCLHKKPNATQEKLMDLLSESYTDISEVLFQLESMDLIERLPGNQFSIVKHTSFH